MSLRSKVIRLAYAQPSLRQHLLPLLATQAASAPARAKQAAFANPREFLSVMLAPMAEHVRNYDMFIRNVLAQLNTLGQTFAGDDAITPDFEPEGMTTVDGYMTHKGQSTWDDPGYDEESSREVETPESIRATWQHKVDAPTLYTLFEGAGMLPGAQREKLVRPFLKGLLQDPKFGRFLALFWQRAVMSPEMVASYVAFDGPGMALYQEAPGSFEGLTFSAQPNSGKTVSRPAGIAQGLLLKGTFLLDYEYDSLEVPIPEPDFDGPDW